MLRGVHWYVLVGVLVTLAWTTGSTWWLLPMGVAWLVGQAHVSHLRVLSGAPPNPGNPFRPDGLASAAEDACGDGNGVMRAAPPQPTHASSLAFAAWKYLQVCPPTSEFQAEAARELQQALEQR